MKAFEAAGVRPVAISVDAPEQSETLRRKAGYTFTFLSDPNLEAIKRYGVVHKGAGEGDVTSPVRRSSWSIAPGPCAGSI